MRFCLVLISFGFWVGQLLAQPSQNLVRNPSFEDITTDGSNCVGLYNHHWFTPTNSAMLCSTIFQNSPTFACDTVYGVPHTNAGDQYPRTGQSYLMFYNFETSEHSMGQWYAYTRLKSQLRANNRYCGEVHLSRADKQLMICQNFGMVFVPDSPAYTLMQYPPYEVQSSNFPVTPNLRRIEYFNLPISAHAQGLDISDTMNWVPLRGGFTANGNERYLGLGNFDPLWLLDTTHLPGYGNWPFYSGGVVFVDDVSVYALKALAHSDSAVCAGGVVQASAYGGYSHYLWSTGDTTATVSLPGPGTYWVEVSNWCGTQRDSSTLRASDTLALEQAIPSQLNLCL